MPGNLALKTTAALRVHGGHDLGVTLAPALPKPRESVATVGGTGTWVGTGICDLRASVTSQQKQLDSLIDRVALLLSSMHSEVLQDVRAAVASPDFEARLTEMRKVGEILDQRLVELRAEAAQVPEGVRMLQVELRRVEDKMDSFDERFREDYEKMQSLVTESLMSVHDRFTSELEGVVTELKKLEGRLGSAETDLGLLSDDDLEATLKEAIQQQAEALRGEFPKFLAPYFEQSSARITALEDHLQREHNDLLLALQQAAAASGVQEGDRALQKDLAKRTKEDLRQQSEELSALSRQISEMKVWHSSAVEDAKLLRIESKQRDQETLGNLQALEERLAATSTRLCHLEDQMKHDATEKRLMAMEELLQGIEENMKAVEPLQRVEDVLTRPRDTEERLLNALEEKLDLVMQDLKRQLETQIQQLTSRDEASRDVQPQREVSKSYLEQRLQESSGKLQQLAADLREDLEQRSQQAQRQGDDLRRELELKMEKRHASAETSMDDLKHQIENASAQQQSVSKKQADDLKQLSADVEIRMVKEQSAAQRATLELRKDLEHSCQEAVNLCSEVLREEQQQLVREFRQELERRLATAPAPILVEGMEELQDLREELQELKETLGATAAGSRAGSPSREATRLLRTVEETVSEQCRRCDAAAERCERLARQMQWQMKPEATCKGSGVPGEQDAYEGLVLHREGPWQLLDSKGRYSFEDTSGWLRAAGLKVARLSCRQFGLRPLAFETSTGSRSPKLKIVANDIMAEMQKKENHGALFLLASGPTGGGDSQVRRVEDYKHVESSDARAQLAAHPAAAQFLLDNAATAQGLGGINVLDHLVSKLQGFDVSKGFLKILSVSRGQEAENLKTLEQELHLLRCLVMEDVAVKGLRPDKRTMAGCEHRVSLLYACALELGADASDYQLKAAELILAAQYYGALRYAAESSQRTQSRRKIFLTPLPGALARWDVLARSMAKALQMLEEDVSSKLSICCLVEDEAMASELRMALQHSCSSSPEAPAKQLFQGSSDSDGSGEFRASPIEESSTESRIMVLMRRVDHQASELQSLREKNEELSEAVDQYNLQQKVSRSLAGLEA